MGHRSGARTVDIITEACARLGIEALTLYAFSTENWKRPREEVNALMALLEDNLKRNAKKLHDNNIRFNVIGRVDGFSEPLRREIDRVRDLTSANTGMVLTLALNYGGRQEILDAMKGIFAKMKEGSVDVSSWNEKDFEGFLYTSGLPDPDLVIRTSGEKRISNFLLWQSAYAEFYVTDTLWPDFDAGQLQKALDEYAKRERRFGG